MTTTKKISELPSAVTPLAGTEDIPIVQDGATRRATPDDIRAGLAETVHAHTLSDITDAGTAAASDVEDFATAAQGTKADSALQEEDVGSAAFEDTTAFATAAQGTKADTAVQPGDLGTAATADAGDFATAAQGTKADTAVQPEDLGTAASADTGDFATAAQGAKADSALQPEDLAYPGLLNAIINGGCLVSHRGNKSLSTSWQYGPVDLLAVKAEGSVSAGTIKQATSAFSLTVTGAACFVENATLTGSGAILFRRRIEARDAALFYNMPAYFSARTYHDVGSTQNYVITIRKATSADDFSSTTLIDSDTVTVANDTNASIAMAISDMGDCRNGIEIEVKISCGAVTTKDFFLAEQQLIIGDAQRPFELRPIALETKLVHRYLRPIAGIIGVANSASNMQAILSHPDMRIAPTYEALAALNMTDGYTADFDQSGPNIANVHENTAHSARVDIALFSGLTSGRFHIQRGTSAFILASAEL
jgi:hypothetical protein